MSPEKMKLTLTTGGFQRKITNGDRENGEGKGDALLGRSEFVTNELRPTKLNDEILVKRASDRYRKPEPR